MRNMKKITFWVIFLAFQIIDIIPCQTAYAHDRPEKTGIAMLVADTISNQVISYSAEPMRPIKLMFDYYHHSKPSTRVGNHIITGSWVDDNGRYGWDDFVHTNTFDPVFVGLEKEYSIFMSREPYSKKLLSQTDAVVIMNADNPAIVPSAHLISDEEISSLQQFVKNGGSLMVMVNAGSAARASEGFEKVQLSKLVRSFGLDWNDDDTHYSDNMIQDGHPHFYDVPVFHYGAGCTLQILPEAPNPEVLLDVYSDAGYTDRQVRGHGIIMVRPGKGKFILVGDVGSWTGNMSRPWADNESILKQLVRYLKPSQGVTPPQLPAGKSWEYEITVAGLQAIPVDNSLSQISRSHYRLFSPREITNMPYFETSALLQLTCKEQTKDQAARLEVKVTDFRWFDEQPENNGDQYIHFTASRQGKVSGMKASGYDAQWLAPDVSVIIALLPVDGIRPGNRWESIESLRVPILRGSDLPPIKQFKMEVTYVGDAQIEGKSCRLLRSSGEIWLDELGVRVDELLPQEEVLRIGGSHYEFLAKHGGKLLFKREQWVDHKTGIVVKARIQTRIVAWIHDLRKPINISNAEKDKNMIVSLAHIMTFKLK